VWRPGLLIRYSPVMGTPHTDWFAISALGFGVIYGVLLHMLYCRIAYGE
jgi:hypothetical protein